MRNANDQLKCNRRLSKCSAAIDADLKRCALNQFDDGSD